MGRYRSPRAPVRLARVRSVARRSALAGLAAFAGALLLFFAIGGFRLWPRISGQHLPLSLIWPFARPLLAAGLELAFLVSVPIALGIAASMRAARTPIGASWQATAWANALLVVGLGTLSFGVSSWLDVQVHAKHATLSGLPPWGRSRRMPLALRVGLFALSAGLAAYAVGRLASLRPWLPVWAGALLGAASSCCLWWAMAWLERQEPRTSAYLVLPAAALAGAALAALALLLVQGIRSYRGRRSGTPVGP